MVDDTEKINHSNNGVGKVTGKEVRGAIYSRVTDMPQLQILTPTLVGSYAVDLSKDLEFRKRLKNTTDCLINNSLIPLFILSTSSALTTGLKKRYRIPIIFTSLVGGTLGINKLQEFYSSNT
jgi:hypothetical protein